MKRALVRGEEEAGIGELLGLAGASAIYAPGFKSKKSLNPGFVSGRFIGELALRFL
jgi:hypothetical protein